MDEQIPFYIIPTLFLLGVCACVPDDAEQLFDERPDDFDVSSTTTAAQPALDESSSNQSEAVEVLAESLNADFNNDGYA